MTSLVALVVATSILVMIPGPNVALIVANSLSYGFRMGAVTVLGTTAGVALQLALVTAGLAVAIDTTAEALTWIRWVGVGYLVWLGVRSWRASDDELAFVAAGPRLLTQGILLAALNPKTLLFIAAFIPQFVPGEATAADMTLVALVFLLVVLLGDLLWAVFASSAARLLGRGLRWRNRLTGAFLMVAGLGLALAHR